MRELSEREVAKIAERPVQERCRYVIGEFDEWLAVHAFRYGFQHADMPQLNDAFRDYFSDTRTARALSGHPTDGPRGRALEEALREVCGFVETLLFDCAPRRNEDGREPEAAPEHVAIRNRAEQLLATLVPPRATS